MFLSLVFLRNYGFVGTFCSYLVENHKFNFNRRILWTTFNACLWCFSETDFIPQNFCFWISFTGPSIHLSKLILLDSFNPKSLNPKDPINWEKLKSRKNLSTQWKFLCLIKWKNFVLFCLYRSAFQRLNENAFLYSFLLSSFFL